MARRVAPPTKTLGFAILAVVICAGAVWHLLRRSEPPEFRVASESDAAARSWVLFVGNSHTSVNDLPGCVARLDPTLGIASLTAPGETLEGHLESDVALREIRSGRYGHVVLQEQSVRPLFDGDSFRESLRQFTGEIRKHGATPVLYETWEHRNPEAVVYRSYPGGPARMAQGLAQEFEGAAEALRVTRAPVGLAFSLAQVKHPEIALVAADGVHASPAGTYLAACVIVEAITKRSVPEPASSCHPQVDPIASKLRSVASEVFGHLERDLPNGALCRSERGCAGDDYCAAPGAGQRGLCVAELDSGAPWDELVGKWVGARNVPIVVESGEPRCTRLPCRLAAPCCNTCRKRTGIQSGDRFAELTVRGDGQSGDLFAGKPCVRPACQEFEDCVPRSKVSFWGRLRKDDDEFRVEAEVVHRE